MRPNCEATTSATTVTLRVEEDPGEPLNAARARDPARNSRRMSHSCAPSALPGDGRLLPNSPPLELDSWDSNRASEPAE